jgi:hypothetical protein
MYRQERKAHVEMGNEYEIRIARPQRKWLGKCKLILIVLV